MTDALIASRFSIDDSTLRTSFREKDVLYAFCNAYSTLQNSFYFGRPSAYGVAELRLPKEIPLSLEFSIQNYQKPPRAFIDLRGLEVEEFNTVYALANSFQQLNIDMALGKPNTRYSVRNDSGSTTINFYQQSRGTMRLYTENGQVDVNHLGVKSNIRINVIGIANSASEFRNRLNLKNSSLVWAEPKLFTEKSNLWIVSGQSKNATSEGFYLEVDLNKQARLEVWN
jgi:hypothetical protein